MVVCILEKVGEAQVLFRFIVQVLLVFLFFYSVAFAQDFPLGWENRDQSTAGFEHRGTLSLALTPVSFEYSTSEGPVLVIIHRYRDINQSLSSLADFFSEKFSVSFGKLEYRYIAGRNDRAKERIRHYLKEGEVLTDNGEFYPDIEEFSYQLEKLGLKGENRKIFCMAEGDDVTTVLRSRFYSEFDACVFFSPPSKIDLTGDEQVTIPFLWVGSTYERGKLERWKKQMIGDIYSYKNGGYGYNILMRNVNSGENIGSWLLGESVQEP